MRNQWGPKVLVCLLGWMLIGADVQAQFVIHAAHDDVMTAEAQSETVLDVLANDFGYLSLDTLSIDGSHATAWIDHQNQTIVFVPRGDFTGLLEFDYTATSLGGSPFHATVTVTVVPVARDDKAFANVGEPILIDVLANDLGAHSVAWVSFSAGTHAIQSDQRILVTPTSRGVHTLHYGLNTINGPTGSVKIRVRDPFLPRPQAPDLEVEKIADGRAIEISLPPLLSSLIHTRDGAYGTTRVMNSSSFEYQQTRTGPGSDRISFFIDHGDGQWGKGFGGLKLIVQGLNHVFDFEDQSGFFDPVLSNSGLSGIDGLRADGFPLVSSPTLSSISAVGNQSLNLSDNNRGLVRVDAPIAKTEGSISTWIRIPATGLKFGTLNDHMTIVSTSADGVSTLWSMTLEPSSSQTASIHVREGFIDFASPELLFEAETWYHLSYVWSQDHRVLMLNGQVIAQSDPSNPFTSGSHLQSASAFAIGNRFECLYSNCGASFAGLIDAFRVYDSRIDPITLAETYLAENPNLQFQLKMDDLTDPLTLGNAASPEDEVELEPVAQAPFKVATSLPEVGLEFGPGGGRLAWEVQPGHLSPDSSWLAWTVQMPDAGFTEDIILFQSEDRQFEVVLSHEADHRGRLVTRHDGQDTLSSDELDLRPGESLNLQVIWKQSEAYFYVDQQMVANSWSFDPGYSQLSSVQVPMAAGVILWMMQYGDGDDAPRDQQQEGFRVSTGHTLVNAVWLPVIQTSHPSIPNLVQHELKLFKGNEGKSFASSCAASVPKDSNDKSICRTYFFHPERDTFTPIVPLTVQHDGIESIDAILKSNGIPMTKRVRWWDRVEKRLNHFVDSGGGYAEIFSKQVIFTNQTLGTGGSKPASFGSNRIAGISTSVWTGATGDGSPPNQNANASCGTPTQTSGRTYKNSWTFGAANGFSRGIIGSAEKTDGRWVFDRPEQSCDQSFTIRCTCTTELPSRKRSKTFRDDFEPK